MTLRCLGTLLSGGPLPAGYAPRRTFDQAPREGLLSGDLPFSNNILRVSASMLLVNLTGAHTVLASNAHSDQLAGQRIFTLCFSFWRRRGRVVADGLYYFGCATVCAVENARLHRELRDHARARLCCRTRPRSRPPCQPRRFFGHGRNARRAFHCE